MDTTMSTDHAQAWHDEPGAAHRGVSRRDALKYGIGALGALALLEAGTAGVLYLEAGVDDGQLGAVVTAGLVEDFSPGSVTEFAASHFFLLRAPDGGFLALHNRCTHLGCTVLWVPADGEFVCPCHAASFDAFGDYAGPPVPRPLDTFPIAFVEGRIQVDTGVPQRRETFEQGQLAYAPGVQLPAAPVAGPIVPEIADKPVEGAGQ